MSITSILTIAKSAILAQQTAIQVTSNNIANANTTGYVRQQTVLTESTCRTGSTGLIGNGVTAIRIAACYDRYLERSVARQMCSAEEWQVYKSYFSRMESILDENTTNLTARVTSFYSAWQALATDPTGTTARLAVVSAGENMCQTIRDIYGVLKNLQAELDEKVGQTVDDVNNILQSIARTNAEMARSGANDTSLLAERTALVKQLSGMVNIQYFENTGGTLTVMTSGGKLLVDGSNYNSLLAEESADGVYRVAWLSASGTKVDITEDISAGSLKSLIDLRDNQVTAFIDDINDLAVSLADEINAIHNTGYTATGVTGIGFFKPVTTTGDYAAVMNLSDEVAASEDYIAATSSTGSTSGNDTALAIAALSSASVTISGRSTTYVDQCTSILSKIGSLSENAQTVSDYHQALLSSVETQRDSVSAVSTDEEMVNLVKFQYAYQAAARLLTTADQLLSSLLEAI